MLDNDCKILQQIDLGADYRTIDFQAPEIADRALPGQFVHLRLPGLEPSALRRPFSIYGAKDGVLRILYKTIGRGTRSMNSLKAGDSVRIMGPIGKSFPGNPESLPILVAGGYGVAPLVFLASRLPQKGIVMIGGRTANDILLQDDFRKMGWEVRIATQDGSLGEQGLVTILLDRALERLQKENKKAELYSCGPDGLLHAVGDRAIAHDLKGWLSLDKHMVCGIGACLACVQKLRKADGTEWIGRVCKDGPVFESREIVW